MKVSQIIDFVQAMYVTRLDVKLRRERRGRVVNARAWHLRGSKFKSRPGDKLS
jgi:hypothetical protein